MLPLKLREDAGHSLRLLCLGAHSDDIEIGCGGTLLQMLARRSQVEVTWVVFSGGAGVREREARDSAAVFLAGAGRCDVRVHRFRDGHFPGQASEIKSCLERLKDEVEPDLILTHHRDDRHQDHRTISDLTWNTWRRHLILEYEIPKYDGDLGTPNVFVPLTKSACSQKARAICEAFPSESGKGWLTEDTFVALARLRGIECAAPEGHAEAFYGRKLPLAF